MRKSEEFTGWVDDRGGDIYEMFDTSEGMKGWLEVSGFTKESFREMTGTDIETLLGKWFTIVDDRLYVD